MAAQPVQDHKASPIYEGDQAMLRLLQQQHARHIPQPPQPANTTQNSSASAVTSPKAKVNGINGSSPINNKVNASPSSNTSTSTSNTNNPSAATSSHRSPVTFETSPPQDILRRPAREVVPGLPRSQTLKRQQSERRDNLTPVEMPPEERRVVSSSDNKSQSQFSAAAASGRVDTANSFATPSAYGSAFDRYSDLAFSQTCSPRPIAEDSDDASDHPQKAPIFVPPPKLQPGVTLIPGTNLPDTTNMPREEFDALIQNELENVWILNLSMHFRDRSKREKFFVTYRERDTLWRRVTISLDYRHAPADSLEGELAGMKFQRDKSAKIYEAIRDSLPDIQFYDTATNLKLQTSEGRLHVHVVEDGNVSTCNFTRLLDTFNGNSNSQTGND